MRKAPIFGRAKEIEKSLTKGVIVSHFSKIRRFSKDLSRDPLRRQRDRLRWVQYLGLKAAGGDGGWEEFLPRCGPGLPLWRVFEGSLAGGSAQGRSIDGGYSHFSISFHLL